MAGVGEARGSRKKMRTNRSLKPFMKGIVGPRKALEFILSEMGSFWRVRSKGET